MEPLAKSPWVISKLELSGETVDDETLSSQSTSPSVPESSGFGMDVVYTLFSVGIIQEPMGIEAKDDVWQQHLDSEVRMDAAQTREELMVARTSSPVNTFKLQPVIWDKVYQPRKANKERILLPWQDPTGMDPAN